jgi:hypothetical protein
MRLTSSKAAGHAGAPAGGNGGNRGKALGKFAPRTTLIRLACGCPDSGIFRDCSSHPSQLSASGPMRRSLQFGASIAARWGRPAPAR